MSFEQRYFSYNPPLLLLLFHYNVTLKVKQMGASMNHQCNCARHWLSGLIWSVSNELVVPAAALVVVFVVVVVVVAVTGVVVEDVRYEISSTAIINCHWHWSTPQSWKYRWLCFAGALVQQLKLYQSLIPLIYVSCLSNHYLCLRLALFAR